jgi:hypothetical protein
MVVQPIGGDDGQDIQRVAQGFDHAFGSAERPNPGQDMGRVGSLLSLSFEPPMLLTQSYYCFSRGALQQLVQPDVSGTRRAPCDQSRGQLFPDGSRVLPVQTTPYRISGLPIG